LSILVLLFESCAIKWKLKIVYSGTTVFRICFSLIQGLGLCIHSMGRKYSQLQMCQIETKCSYIWYRNWYRLSN